MTIRPTDPFLQYVDPGRVIAPAYATNVPPAYATNVPPARWLNAAVDTAEIVKG